MGQEITVHTQVNPETEMIHVRKVSVKDIFHQAYCGYRTRDTPPEEETIEIDGEEVCTTCVSIYLRHNEDDLDFTLDEETRNFLAQAE